MIVNKIRRKTPDGSAHRAEFGYMSRLSRYVVRAELGDLRKLALMCDDDYLRDLAHYAVAEGRQEEAIASGALNVLAVDLAGWQAEMAALLHRCPDSLNALDHWVLSWAAGDEPTVGEVEKSVEIFAQCQGLANCPVIWGYHGDTDNRHVHLAILKIDPTTGDRQTAGQGWDVDAGHRAKAVIEAEFPHWQREEGSLYEVIDSDLVRRGDGQVVGPAKQPERWSRYNERKSRRTACKDINRHLSPASRAYEEETGFKSRERVALEVAIPIATAVSSWDQAHAQLAAEGIALQLERSGAAFLIDGKTVKSSIGRVISLKDLEQRYGGPFEESPHPVQPVPKREMWPNDAQRQRYYAAKRTHDEALSVAFADVRRALGRSSEITSAALRAARESAAFPSFAAWIDGSHPADPLETLASATGMAVFSVSVAPPEERISATLQGFEGKRVGDRTIYRKTGESGGPPAFVDIGQKIFVTAARDPEAVRASLLILAKRFPENRIAVTGDKRFRELVLTIADEEGVRLDGHLGRRQDKLRSPQRSRTAGAASRPKQTEGSDRATSTDKKQAPEAATEEKRLLPTKGEGARHRDYGPGENGSATKQAEVGAPTPKVDHDRKRHELAQELARQAAIAASRSR